MLFGGIHACYRQHARITSGIEQALHSVIAARGNDRHALLERVFNSILKNVTTWVSGAER